MHHCPGKSRKDDFITDLNTQIHLLPVDGLAFFPGYKVTDLGDHFSQEREPFFKGDVFAVRDKVNFVVTVDDACLLIKENGTVVIRGSRFMPDNSGGADEIV